MWSSQAPVLPRTRSSILDARIVSPETGVTSINVTDHLMDHLVWTRSRQAPFPLLANEYILSALGSNRLDGQPLLVLRVTTMDLDELHFSGSDEVRLP